VRLTDLLGAEAVTIDGTRLGKVHDVRLVQDGPPIGAWGAAFRVRSLLVGPRSVGVRLGFDRAGVRGPWILKAPLVAWHRSLVEIGWERVAAVTPEAIRVRGTGQDRPEGSLAPARPPAGRVLDAGLELLDLQLVDPDGRLAGKVDDLELTFGEGGPPVVTAILAGPGALARRLGGRLGTWIARIHRRLQDRDLEGPARIGLGTMVRLDEEVHLDVSRRDLPTDALEAWVRTRIVEKIPGAGPRPRG
jgi:sporulation protein YlmC with PRC-barrel domain